MNSNAWREGLSEGPDCLTLTQLEQVLANKSSGLRSFASRHVDGCAHCQAEMAMLSSFESTVPSEDEESVASWIADRLQSGTLRPEVATPPIPFRPARTSPRFSYLTGGAIAATVTLVFSLYVFDRAPHPSLDGTFSNPQIMRSGTVRLNSPLGDPGQPSQTFRWEAFPGAATYVVQVLEVDGTLLWKGHSSDTQLASGAELTTKVRPGKPLLWRVTALNKSGEAIATSDRQRFYLGGQDAPRAQGQ